MYAAMKAGEKEKSGTLRITLAKLKDKRIEKREDLSEEEEMKYTRPEGWEWKSKSKEEARKDSKERTRKKGKELDKRIRDMRERKTKRNAPRRK